MYDHKRMKATLRDMMSNQFRDAKEYAYHLEQSKNYMENQIVWEIRKEDIRRSKPYALVLYGPQRNPNEPPRYLYNKVLFFLKYGNSEERKYVFSLHKIHVVPFPEEDLEEKMNPRNRKLLDQDQLNYTNVDISWVMDLVEIVKVYDATLERVLKDVKLEIFENEFLKKAPLLGELDLDIMKAYEREKTKHLRNQLLGATRPELLVIAILRALTSCPSRFGNAVLSCQATSFAISLGGLTELITPDLICPSTYQLLRNSSGDSGHDLSFDKSASPERLFSLARISLAEASKPVLSFECSEGDYTSSCPPSLVSAKLAYRADDDLVDRAGDWFSFSKHRAPSPDASIDDPRPAAGSFNMADVRHLSAHVVKLRDMPEGTGVEVQEEPYLDVKPTLQRIPFYCTPPAAVDAVIPEPAPKDLAIGTPSSMIVAKAVAFQKRKASTSGTASSHVGKRNSDDDACVEISLVTPLHSAVVIPPSGNQDRNSNAPAAGGSNTRFLTKEVFKDPAICKTIVDQFYTLGEMVCVESLSDDQLTAKMSVLNCMMMSHGGELLARYHGLNQSYHEYVLSIDSRLKGYKEKVANLTGLELQVSTLKKQVFGLNDKLATSNASFAKSNAKGKEKKKKSR
ncbi:hypothetical protein Tco_0591756 [Tanacetum coccineum]